MTTVYVTNKSKNELITDYACKELVFPINKPVEISIAIARHIFGYGEVNKEPHMASLGFIKTTNDIPEGLKVLESFEITEELPQRNHALSPVVERVPLPHKKGGGNFSAMPA